MKNLKRISLFALGIIALAKYAINYRQNKKEEKEHRLILKLLIDSDERIKKLIENENIEEKGIRFRKHPESDKFCDTSARTIWMWGSYSNRNISVSLDKDNQIIPYDNDVRLITLAHEFGHIEVGNFGKSRGCGDEVEHCLSSETQADTLAVKRLEKINVKFNKVFWRARLIHKLWQCEECLKKINKKECPQQERKKIRECFKKIQIVRRER